MTLVMVPCAVCGGGKFEPVYPGTIQTASDCDPTGHFSSSRSRAGYWPIVRCTGCGLVMANPRDDDDTLAGVYARLRDPAYDAEETNRLRTARTHLALVRSHRSRPGRLLDVGCSTGLFVRLAREEGWEAVGLEASAWAVERAREACPEAAFIQAPLEEADVPPGSFDVVTLWDVLEHLCCPMDALRRLNGWLAPGGWMCLNLPNVASLPARLMGRHWVLLLREHLWYFSPATLGNLLHRTGFDLVGTVPNQVNFSVANIAARIGQYPGPVAGLARRLAGAGPLRKLSVRFPIGEMTVVARKWPRGDSDRDGRR